jgi:hypothetical protein
LTILEAIIEEPAGLQYRTEDLALLRDKVYRGRVRARG